MEIVLPGGTLLALLFYLYRRHEKMVKGIVDLTCCRTTIR